MMISLVDRIKVLFDEKTKRHEARENSPNLHQRLHNLLRDGIINNDIPLGVSLPPTRKLSDALGISRSTVIKAYELLKLEGYLESVQGSGHVVKNTNSDPIEIESSSAYNYAEISETAKSYGKNVTLINSTDDKSIAFRPGLPPLDIFPVNHWKNLSNAYWRYIKSSALSYSPSTGIDLLKHNIANYLNLSRNIKCDPRQIIIVSGSLQSLYLTGNVLLNPGDGVVMENPTFPNVYSIFKGMRAKITGVEVDDEGIRTDLLSSDPKKHPKLIHVTPSSHYPNGVRMSVKRRVELLDYASKAGAYIIENDYEHEVHNQLDTLPPVFAMDKQNRTIYLSTFNRLLHPSIRIGYMVLPPQLIEYTEALLKHSHRFVPPSIQVVLNQFIERNYLHTHVRKVTIVAEEREQIFTEEFNEHLGKMLTLQPHQTPSLHLVAELKNNASDKAVTDLLAKHNIITHPLSKCYVTDEKKHGLILGYSSVRPPVIRTKVMQMEKILKN